MSSKQSKKTATKPKVKLDTKIPIISEKEKAERLINEYYGEIEKWIPAYDEDDIKKWKQVPKLDAKKYVPKKKINEEYIIDEKMIDEKENMSILQKKYDIVRKIEKLDDGVVLMLKYYTVNWYMYTYTTNPMLYSIKSKLDFYLLGTDSTLLPFGDIKTNNVKVKLVDIFYTEHPRTCMEKLKEQYSSQDTISDICTTYLNLFKTYETLDIPIITSYIYLFDDKKKKYIFSSSENVTKKNINEYLDGIDMEFDEKKHTIKLLKKIDCVFEKQVCIEMDRYLEKYKWDEEKTYNESPYYVDFTITPKQAKYLEKRIFRDVQYEKFDRFYIDKPDTFYATIHKYIYKIDINGKIFIGISNGDVSVKNFVKILYQDDVVEDKYKNVSKALKDAKYEDIDITIFKETSTKKNKKDLNGIMDKKKKEFLTDENSLEYKKPIASKGSKSGIYWGFKKQAK